VRVTVTLECVGGGTGAAVVASGGGGNAVAGACGLCGVFAGEWVAGPGLPVCDELVNAMAAPPTAASAATAQTPKAICGRRCHSLALRSGAAAALDGPRLVSGSYEDTASSGVVSSCDHARESATVTGSVGSTGAAAVSASLSSTRGGAVFALVASTSRWSVISINTVTGY
jgi:hypothetical protein